METLSSGLALACRSLLPRSSGHREEDSEEGSRAQRTEGTG